MNSDSGQSALNAVLRLDPGEGFFLQREYATYGAVSYTHLTLATKA